MGYYTELNLDVKLKAPSEILDAIEALCSQQKPALSDPPKFFTCGSYERVFACSGCDDGEPASVFKRTRDGGALLRIRSYFKNYDDEIDLLCTWLSPYVVVEGKTKCGSQRGDEGCGSPIYFPYQSWRLTLSGKA